MGKLPDHWELLPLKGRWHHHHRHSLGAAGHCRHPWTPSELGRYWLDSRQQSLLLEGSNARLQCVRDAHERILPCWQLKGVKCPKWISLHGLRLSPNCHLTVFEFTTKPLELLCRRKGTNKSAIRLKWSNVKASAMCGRLAALGRQERPDKDQQLTLLIILSRLIFLFKPPMLSGLTPKIHKWRRIFVWIFRRMTIFSPRASILKVLCQKKVSF